MVPSLPPVDQFGILKSELVEVLKCYMVTSRSRPKVEILVCWQGQMEEEATWEDFAQMKETYPHLVDKVL